MRYGWFSTNLEHERIIENLRSRYYFQPIEKELKRKMKKYGLVDSLNHLTEVMYDSSDTIGDLIKERIDQGLISDSSQARKSVAGHGFQSLVAYALIILQSRKLIPQKLIMTLKPRSHNLIKRYAYIEIQGETQKPDIDLLIYRKPKPEQHPILIFSLKTSLRERAGQTYKWKLLVDIATSKDCQSLKDKYQIGYSKGANLLVGFITADFYDEIYQPQQQGMLKFFNFAYVTKTTVPTSLKTFSCIVNDLNQLYSK